VTKTKAGGAVLLNLLGNGIRIVFSFVAVLLAARWLGASDFGTVNIILGYTVFLQYLLALGFDHALTFYIPKCASTGQYSRANAFLRFSISASLLLALLIFIPAALWLPSISVRFSDPVFWAPFLVIGAQMELFALGNVTAGFLRGVKKFIPVIVKDQFLFPAGQLVFILVFVKFLDMGVMGYAWAYALASAVALIYLIPPTWATLCEWRASGAPPEAGAPYKEFLSFSVPVALMNTFEPLFVWTGIIVMGKFLSPGEIGVFSVAFRTAVLLHFFFKAVVPIFSPYLAEAHHAGNHAEFSSLYQTVNMWCLKWVLCVAFVLLALPAEILSVFGREYAAGVNVLLIMLPGLCFEGIFGGARMTLVMAGKNRVDVINYAAVIAFNVAATYLLVPRYGLAGGAAAISSMFVLLNLLRVAELGLMCGVWPFSVRQLKPLSFLAAVFLLLDLALRTPALTSKARIVVTMVIFSAGLVSCFWGDRGVFLSRLKRKAPAPSVPVEQV